MNTSEIVVLLSNKIDELIRRVDELEHHAIILRSPEPVDVVPRRPAGDRSDDRRNHG